MKKSRQNHTVIASEAKQSRWGAKHSPKALPRLPRHSVPRNDIGWQSTEIALGWSICSSLPGLATTREGREFQ